MRNYFRLPRRDVLRNALVVVDMWEELTAYSHCTEQVPRQVRRTGLTQQETMGLVPVPFSDQCELYCLIY